MIGRVITKRSPYYPATTVIAIDLPSIGKAFSGFAARIHERQCPYLTAGKCTPVLPSGDMLKLNPAVILKLNCFDLIYYNPYILP